jgi:hypothetical protein
MVAYKHKNDLQIGFKTFENDFPFEIFKINLNIIVKRKFSKF